MRTRLLPQVGSWKACGRINNKLRIWRRPVAVVLARHGLPPARIQPVFLGSSPVFLVGGRTPRVMVKFYPPVGLQHWKRESAALQAVAVRGEPPVPRIMASGTLCDRSTWHYLIMVPVPGTAVRWVSNRLMHRDWLTVMREAGQMLRQLHAIPAPRELPSLDAAAWTQRALRACAASHRFSTEFLAELRDRLPALTSTPHRSGRALLHGDMNGTHIAVKRQDGGWHVTGFFDFGNALAGDPIYECLPFWHSMGNDPQGLRAFIRGWRPTARITKAWRERASAYVLLHSEGPGPVLQACRMLRIDPTRLTWNRLCDLLFPPVLDGQSAANGRRLASR